MAREIQPTIAPLVQAFVQKTLEQGIDFFDTAGQHLSTEAEVVRAFFGDGAIHRRRRREPIH